LSPGFAVAALLGLVVVVGVGVVVAAWALKVVASTPPASRPAPA